MKKSLFLFCVALFFTFAGCGEQKESVMMDTTISVETATAEIGALSAESTYIGTVSAEGTASVVSLVSGTVEDVFVSVGDEVKAGDILCCFDDESARLSVEGARSGYNSAKQSLNGAQMAYNSSVASYGGEDLKIVRDQVDMAEKNYNAVLELFEIGAASQLEVDQALQALNSANSALEAAQIGLNAAMSNVDMAKAGVDSAQVGLASAEYQLSLYTLTTPISGVVEAVNVISNNFAPSGTAAFVISNENNKTVTFYVSDDVMKRMTIGQAVKVSAQGKEYSGAVSEIGRMVDSYTGLFRVKAIVNDASEIPDGLSVSVTTISNVANNAVIISSDSLYFDNGVPFVYVVENGMASRRDVEVVLYTKEKVAVSAGLEESDEIITSWSPMLKDGAVIRTSEKAASDAETDEVTEK